MAAWRRKAAEVAVERASALDGLLRERDGLLTVLDRTAALRGTARLIRQTVGADAGFVADIGAEDTGHGDNAMIRWLSGMRTDRLNNLVVPSGQGIGGRVLASGKPVRVSDYVSSTTITHQFDAHVSGEGMAAMLAVPVRCGQETVAVAYAAMRRPSAFGDDAVARLERVADQAATALRIAGTAESGKADAVTAERQRMADALHDSVGALLFSIGAQVRDLQEAARDNPALDPRLRKLESDVSSAAGALRESLLALSETASPERALEAELAQCARSFESRTGVPAGFVRLGPVPALDGERSGFLVAVVREGLLNVEKHAKARSVVVSFGPVEQGVQLAVADDGTGGTGTDIRSEGTGMGVRSLAARAARLGGKVSLVRDLDDGCTLRAWLPDVLT
ncbi:histidine kinase [Prauserella marina]|nr:GAF domain-containing protein [Prauserella marina]ASR38458.1 histidine kinase [Prauserella marina]